MAPTYVRRAGHLVAERVRPVPGSPDAQRLAAAADDPASPWQREAVPEPSPAAGRPPQSAPVADWRAWADSRDPGDHTTMTKADLISQYGGA